MSVKASPGQKVGARKVDAESYIPEPGDWEETNIIWDFGDGWLICDNQTEYDRRLTATLTLTCVASLNSQCLPFDEEGYMRSREIQTRRNYDTPYYENLKGRNWIEEKIQTLLKEDIRRSGKDPVYKILHVRDPEGRPRACVLAALWSCIPSKGGKAPFGYYPYLDSDDLGQSHPIIIDGQEFMILEVRIGTGKAAPWAVEDRVVQWYAESTGEWDEDAYLVKQFARKEWEAVQPMKADELADYRRKKAA